MSEQLFDSTYEEFLEDYYSDIVNVEFLYEALKTLTPEQLEEAKNKYEQNTRHYKKIRSLRRFKKFKKEVNL